MIWRWLNVTLLAKTCIVCTSMHAYWRKKTKFQSSLWNYACCWKIFTRIDGARNQQMKLQINKNYMPSYLPGYGEFENLFPFCSLNGECVTCICLHCSRCKQNRYHFLGKNSNINKWAVSLIYCVLVWPITGEHFKLNPST